MKNTIIAAVAVVALGALAATALASTGSEDRTTTQPAAATPQAAHHHVRREDRREDRRADRREDRRVCAPGTSKAATPDDRTARDASGHGGRGRDHAEDDGSIEEEHHGHGSRDE